MQKEKDADFRKELEDIKNAPFARCVLTVVALCVSDDEGRKGRGPWHGRERLIRVTVLMTNDSQVRERP